jgi:hypothetical protein
VSDQNDLIVEIRALHEKLDRVLALLEASKPKTPAGRSRARTPKPKPVPLTEAEITDLQAQFDNLFSRWLDGHELEVQDELEMFDVEKLRRFADANNLNITAKMPKQRVLQLIGARFREKRQLHRGTSSPGEGSLPGDSH